MSIEWPKMSITMKPIGYVWNDVLEPSHEGWDEVTSDIVLEPKYAEGLEGIEGFSHVVVLFWIHGVPLARRRVMKIHPRDREDIPLLGVFATRTQYRPNPIGMSIVSLLHRENNVLAVQGLDAIHRTPVLDIKPLVPWRDLGTEVQVPEWLRFMHATRR